MSDLLKDRLDINQKPFHNTGIDFFGPILEKKKKKRHGQTRQRQNVMV